MSVRKVDEHAVRYLWQTEIVDLTFIRTSEWQTRKVKVQEKAPDGKLTPIAPTVAAEMSWDLSIRGIRVGDGGASLHRLDEKFILKPNTCVVLETREHITTGPEVLGFICSRASLASKGLIVSNLKVDPNYSDTLYITVFNAGTGSIPLKPRDPFCAIVFGQTDGICTVQTRRPDPEGISSGWIERIERTAPYVVTGMVSIILSVVGSILAMLMMGMVG